MRDHEFALCLTHDVDRPRKTYQGVYRALRGDPIYHLRTILPGSEPYWRFEDLMNVEDSLGVRSAVYFLREPPLIRRGLRALAHPSEWVESMGRYDPADEPIVGVMRRLAERGWEVGIHGSRTAATDRTRMEYELRRLEGVLDGRIRGGRHHHLELEVPQTWRIHADLGLEYDTTLGSTTETGFEYGYQPLRPLDGDFMVFPLTIMEQALPDPGEDFEAAWEVCRSLLSEAAENDAVMTVLWHQRYFSRRDFPGYRRLYRRLIEEALDRDAWVGPPADLVDRCRAGRIPTQSIPSGGMDSITKASDGGG